MPDENEIPNVHCDGVGVMVNPFGVILRLTESYPPEIPPQGKPPDPKTLAHVRMSLEHAKVLAIILRKALKEHEDGQSAVIPIHPAVNQVMGISPKEDW